MHKSYMQLLWVSIEPKIKYEGFGGGPLVGGGPGARAITNQGW